MQGWVQGHACLTPQAEPSPGLCLRLTHWFLPLRPVPGAELHALRVCRAAAPPSWAQPPAAPADRPPQGRAPRCCQLPLLVPCRVRIPFPFGDGSWRVVPGVAPLGPVSFTGSAHLAAPTPPRQTLRGPRPRNCVDLRSVSRAPSRLGSPTRSQQGQGRHKRTHFSE